MSISYFSSMSCLFPIFYLCHVYVFVHYSSFLPIFLCMCAHKTACLSVSLFIYQFVYGSDYLCVISHIYLFLSVCLSAKPCCCERARGGWKQDSSLKVSLSIYRSIHPSIFLFIYLFNPIYISMHIRHISIIILQIDAWYSINYSFFVVHIFNIYFIFIFLARDFPCSAADCSGLCRRFWRPSPWWRRRRSRRRWPRKPRPQPCPRLCCSTATATGERQYSSILM